MDYKYIEQLLERYWRCETSLEEEAILKTFFNQTHIPSHLMPYKPLFVSEKMWQEIKLNFHKNREESLTGSEHPANCHESAK